MEKQDVMVEAEKTVGVEEFASGKLRNEMARAEGARSAERNRPMATSQRATPVKEFA